jgi:hypothetical protein
MARLLSFSESRTEAAIASLSPADRAKLDVLLGRNG